MRESGFSMASQLGFEDFAKALTSQRWLVPVGFYFQLPVLHFRRCNPICFQHQFHQQERLQ